MTSALDGSGQFALLLCGHAGDAAGDDLATFRHKALKQFHVFVIDLRGILARKGAGFAAARKWRKWWP